MIVTGLFDQFKHTINFSAEGITLLLGLNGIGKTVILRMINSFFSNNLSDFAEYYFETVLFEFEEEGTIILTKQIIEEDGIPTQSLNIERNKPRINLNEKYDSNKETESFNIPISIPSNAYPANKFYGGGVVKKIKKWADSSQMYFDYYNDETRDEITYILTKYLPKTIRHSKQDYWYDTVRDKLYRTKDIVSIYSKYLPSQLVRKFGYPDWLIEATKAYKVKFIETQRLLSIIDFSEGKYANALNQYSRHLIDTIKNKRSAASDLSAQLDKSFPNRLIARSSKESEFVETDIQQQLHNLNTKREFLSSVGLIDTNDESIEPISDYSNSYTNSILLNVLDVYIEDSYKKLNTYDELAQKINLFTTLVNKRFRFKKIIIDRNDGFKFYSTYHKNSTEEHVENEIPLIGLSSGEQHELVLFYQLIFSDDSFNLLLIDEPEISLHISWQKQFIDDLREVIKINNIDVIIATHSPDIIGNNWNLTVHLDADNKI